MYGIVVAECDVVEAGSMLCFALWQRVRRYTRSGTTSDGVQATYFSDPLVVL